MDHDQLLYIGESFAAYFVYCCEGEHYVQMIDQFRWAKTRMTLIEAMIILLEHSQPDLTQTTPLTDEDWKRLTTFIQTADIQQVRNLHTTMIRYISVFELEKIQKTEEYLTKLLIHFEEGD